MVKLSAIQMCSVPDVAENLSRIDSELARLSPSEQQIVVLPECCLFFGGKDRELLQLAMETTAEKRLQNSLAALAKKHQVYLIAGSIPILTSAGDRYTNRCCTFSPEGVEIGNYDKIHLFDVNVADNEKNYRESTYTQAGKSVELVKTPLAAIGLSICYDLRFPELYRQLRILGAEIITVPSAFTEVTGQAHWQALLQSRAIENQVYIVAAAQQGQHNNGRRTWGHSMIISPWGEILSCIATGEGAISANFMPQELAQVRTAMPVIEHNKFEIKLKSYE